MVLTEREALTQFENNNISSRMRLKFIGTTTGKATEEAKEEVTKLIDAERPENYASMEKEHQARTDFNIRQQKADEIKKIKDDAFQKDLEEAKENGIKQPRKSLHIHTMSDTGHSRDEILNEAKGFMQ